MEAKAEIEQLTNRRYQPLPKGHRIPQSGRAGLAAGGTGTGRLQSVANDEHMKERRMVLQAVKAFHTLAWFTIEACMVYVLYSGIRARSDRWAGLAASVVAGETLVFAANGFHCPLTAVAKRLGDSTGSVTDIYLPKWLARNLPAVHVPLIVFAAVVHWRNLRSATGTQGGLKSGGARVTA